jgi:hypothetical protein
MKEQALNLVPGNYHRIEFTLSAGMANAKALVFVILILLIYIPLYLIVWPEQFTFSNLTVLLATYKTWILFSPAILLTVFIVGALLHEMLHGFTWAFFCKDGLKSIRYGIHWKLLTPYCHCKETLPLSAYVLGGIMPGLVMGVLPAILGLLTGKLLLFLFGLFFSIAASGDLLVLWMLRNQSKEDLVQDHPDKIGCFVFVKN